MKNLKCDIYQFSIPEIFVEKRVNSENMKDEIIIIIKKLRK